MSKIELKKKFLYEKTINSVITHAQCTGKKEDARTTIYIPMEQEILLKDLEDEYGKSGTCTIRYAIQFGFAIFEHENKNTLKQISELRKRLRYSDNPIIPSYLFLLKINIEKIENPIKRNVIQDINIITGIKKNSDNLNISLNSFIQILLTYALSTIKTNNTKIIEIRNNAREEKIRFQTTINNILDILIRLVAGEHDEILLGEKS